MTRTRQTFVATLLLTTIAAAADVRQYGAWSNRGPYPSIPGGRRLSDSSSER